MAFRNRQAAQRARRVACAAYRAKRPSFMSMAGRRRSRRRSRAGRSSRRACPRSSPCTSIFLFCPNGGFYNYQTSRICNAGADSPLACLTENCNYALLRPETLARSAALWNGQFRQIARGVFGFHRHLPNFSARWSRRVCQRAILAVRVSNPVRSRGSRSQRASRKRRVSVRSGASRARRGAVAPRRGRPPRRRLAGLRTAGRAGCGRTADDFIPEARICSGWREPAEVRERMRAARALVFPSLWYEGQPLTVMEAMALGAPVHRSPTLARGASIDQGRPDKGLYVVQERRRRRLGGEADPSQRRCAGRQTVRRRLSRLFVEARPLRERHVRSNS